jgi:acyl-CoA dehydrogenase
VKAGTVQPAPGESLVDAALTAGVIDAVEAEQLRTAELARRKVIDVDDFAKEELELQEGRIR